MKTQNQAQQFTELEECFIPLSEDEKNAITPIARFISVVQRKLHHRTKLLLLSCGTLLTCLSLTTLAAFATAYGVQPWDSFNIPKVPVPVPAGVLRHLIIGDGNNIESENAGFSTSFGPLCNWKIDYVYFDVNNVERRRIKGPVHSSCNFRVSDNPQTVYPGKVPYGKACVSLYSSGEYITRQCHFITE